MLSAKRRKQFVIVTTLLVQLMLKAYHTRKKNHILVYMANHAKNV